jgi:hypothetical protein
MPRQINYGTTTFTKTAGGAVTITTVRKFSYKTSPKVIKDKGDGDFYPTDVRVIEAEPTVSLEHRNAQLIKSLPPGTAGVLSIVHLDADNGVGAGAITFSFANAVIGSHDMSSEHANYNTVSLEIHAKATDGTTNPMTMTIAV